VRIGCRPANSRRVMDEGPGVGPVPVRLASETGSEVRGRSIRGGAGGSSRSGRPPPPPEARMNTMRRFRWCRSVRSDFSIAAGRSRRARVAGGATRATTMRQPLMRQRALGAGPRGRMIDRPGPGIFKQLPGRAASSSASTATTTARSPPGVRPGARRFFDRLDRNDDGDPTRRIRQGQAAPPRRRPDEV